MKLKAYGFFRSILIFFLVLVVVRFSPIIIRVILVLTSIAVRFWWAILPMIVISGVIWKIIKKRPAVTKSEEQPESQRLRDVTGTVKEKHD